MSHQNHARCILVILKLDLSSLFLAHSPCFSLDITYLIAITIALDLNPALGVVISCVRPHSSNTSVVVVQSSDGSCLPSEERPARGPVLVGGCEAFFKFFRFRLGS